MGLYFYLLVGGSVVVGLIAAHVVLLLAYEVFGVKR